MSQLTLTPASRAVERLVEPGCDARCARCRGDIEFVMREGRRQVIANVYVEGRWDRVEHFHDACYAEAGAPYGPASTHQATRAERLNRQG